MFEFFDVVQLLHAFGMFKLPGLKVLLHITCINGNVVHFTGGIATGKKNACMILHENHFYQS